MTETGDFPKCWQPHTRPHATIMQKNKIYVGKYNAIINDLAEKKSGYFLKGSNMKRSEKQQVNAVLLFYYYY
jgi:hypothetical protein